MNVGTKARDALLIAINKIKARTMPKRVRMPNCTHVDMDRIYGQNQQCFVCGREPSLGFLYECRQDNTSPSLHSLISTANLEREGLDRKQSILRSELEAAGLSESVIRAAEEGHYTPAQLKLLKSQKRELRQTIEDSIQGSQINDVVAKLAALASPTSSDVVASTNSKDAVYSHTARERGSTTGIGQSSNCGFRACHTCRPYYRDRVYISFEAVASADFPPISEAEAKTLPTKSARALRSMRAFRMPLSTSFNRNELPFSAQTTITFAPSIDLPHNAASSSDSSELTFKTTQTDVDELRALRRPRRRFYDIGHKSSDDIAREISRIPSLLSRQGLRTAMQAIFHPGRDSSSSGSMITLPVPRTGKVRNPKATRPVGDFDIGALRRVRRQKEKNELRNGTYVGGFEGVVPVQATPKPVTTLSRHSSQREGSLSSESDFSVYSCISDSSELDSDGGVALTEEAVESHIPDMIAVDVSASKSNIRIKAREMGCEHDGLRGDVGLQSIMTQV